MNPSNLKKGKLYISEIDPMGFASWYTHLTSQGLFHIYDVVLDGNLRILQKQGLIKRGSVLLFFESLQDVNKKPAYKFYSLEKNNFVYIRPRILDELKLTMLG